MFDEPFAKIVFFYQGLHSQKSQMLSALCPINSWDSP